MINSLTLRHLNEGNVDEILELQEAVFADITDDRILRRNTREMFELCTKEPNISLGLYSGSEMVGVAIVVDVAGTEEDLTLHLKTHDASGLKPCNLKLVMIKKSCYGQRFQYMSMWLLETIMKSRGYECICSTVSPDNAYSMNNCLKLDYVFDHEEVKYGGLVRNVFFKNIDKEPVNEEITKLITALMSGEEIAFADVVSVKNK